MRRSVVVQKLLWGTTITDLPQAMNSHMRTLANLQVEHYSITSSNEVQPARPVSSRETPAWPPNPWPMRRKFLANKSWWKRFFLKVKKNESHSSTGWRENPEAQLALENSWYETNPSQSTFNRPRPQATLTYPMASNNVYRYIRDNWYFASPLVFLATKPVLTQNTAFLSIFSLTHSD